MSEAYRCAKCTALYEVKVSECDCEVGQEQKFITVHVLSEAERAQLLAVAKAAKEFRIAFAVHRDYGGRAAPVVATEINLIKALSALAPDVLEER